MSDDLLVLFPGALGDFLCLRPSLLALRARTQGRIVVAVHPALFPLLPPAQFEPLSIDRREFADLFAAAPLNPETRECLAGFSRAVSWTGHGHAPFAERLSSATGGEVAVHAFRALRPGEHAVDYYARCAGVEPVLGTLVPEPDATDWAAAFWKQQDLGDRTLVLHPGSGSPPKNWQGMSEIAAWWRKRSDARLLSILGPAEVDWEAELPADAVVKNEPLDRVAALLHRSHQYLGNDSGISHLAGAVGAHTIALFGPTDPCSWRPLGPAVQVVHSSSDCVLCGPDVFCTHRLPVDEVIAKIVAGTEH